MKEPLVSVIMSEYNTDEKLLRESINSILNQSYKNFEIILIDDCGKNNVKKIVKELKDQRIKLYKNDKNMGLVYSLNKAIKLSNGEYIARMDTDDYSYKNRFEKQVNYFNNHPDIDLVCGRVHYYDGNEIWGKSSSCLTGVIGVKQLINGSCINHPTIMAKRNVLLQLGGYPNYNRCEDYALWIEMATNGYKLFCLNDYLLRYHLSLNDYKKRSLKTRKGFFKLIKKEYGKLKPTKIQILKMYLKSLIAGIIPYKIMYNYHRAKFKNFNKEKGGKK